MKKILSFSLFGARDYPADREFEMNAYIRGFVWNVKMAKLIFPSFNVHVELSADVYSLYDPLIRGLQDHYGVTFNINREETLCRSMLWRLKEIFKEDSHYVFCRDCDSLVTYREAQMIEWFIQSGLYVHNICDNPAHSIPIMGGLCGFKSEPLRSKYASYNNLLSKSPIGIDARGTDQNFLNLVIYPDFKDSMMGHFLKGYPGNGEHSIIHFIDNMRLEGISPELWQSNLCILFAGAAGVNDLETIRFFRTFDKEIPEFIDIEKRYPKIFYWKQ